MRISLTESYPTPLQTPFSIESYCSLVFLSCASMTSRPLSNLVMEAWRVCANLLLATNPREVSAPGLAARLSITPPRSTDVHLSHTQAYTIIMKLSTALFSTVFALTSLVDATVYCPAVVMPTPPVVVCPIECCRVQVF